MGDRIKAVLFDIDGTLVDSNDLHVAAWDEAFRDAGHRVDKAAIRGQIGKGGDLLVPFLLPDTGEDEQEALAQAHGRIFKARYLDGVRPFAHAHDLLARVVAAGGRVVLASSAGSDELEHYAGLLDAADLLSATTSSDDVATSKPAPDIFATALARLAPLTAGQVIVVGDTPYDIAAAGKCGIATVAVRSGGFDDDALREAGAIALYDDVAELLRRYDESPLAA